MQTSIPCTFMRGGSSRGPYFLAADLPDDMNTRDTILLEVLGSADDDHISGIGGRQSVMKKVAIVSPSTHPDADVDYLFAQVDTSLNIVDTSPTCGNMLSGVGPFAIEQGIVEVDGPTTSVRIRDVNTGSFAVAEVETPDGQVNYYGETTIGGVKEKSAPVKLKFQNMVGNKTGALLPTGNATDVIEGLTVSLIDVSVPMVHFDAAELQLTGKETSESINQNTALLARLESVRLKASEIMGLGDARGKVIPKMAILSSADDTDSNICSRYFVPEKCHPAHAVTGAFCIASSTFIEGTLAHKLAKQSSTAKSSEVTIQHPTGTISVDIEYVEGAIQSAGVTRTCKRIMSGYVHVPFSLWPGKNNREKTA